MNDLSAKLSGSHTDAGRFNSMAINLSLRKNVIFSKIVRRKFLDMELSKNILGFQRSQT